MDNKDNKIDQKENRNTITYKYKFEPNYNPFYINGAYGGVNPQGEIVANFYLERIALPNSSTHIVDKDGRIQGNAIKKDPADLDNSCIRFVQTGIVMNLETAKQIKIWLENNINNLEKLQQQ